MNTRLDKYFARHADFQRHPVESISTANVEQVVVIPALAERANLPATLDSLALNPPDERNRTLVIITVNNRAPRHSRDDYLADNQATLAWLRAIAPTAQLRLGIIDAASPGRELGDKEGVGAARKIGMDWALRILMQNDCPDGPIVCLDADTHVAPDYLAAVRNAFRTRPWAAVIAYAHSLDGNPARQKAIIAYELYLRYYTLGLLYAGSPYAFHTIGSTMACAANAYLAVSGMNRRQAGEDFYFLMKLAKTGPVHTIYDTTVQPASRISDRVPFGTGAAITRFTDGSEDPYTTYDARVFFALKQWLTCATDDLATPAANSLKQAGRDIPGLATFFEKAQFDETLAKLRAHSSGAQALLRQFHRWFDGFRTLKLLHHLRDTAYPNADLLAGLRTLLCTMPHTDRALAAANDATHEDLDSQIALLTQLRELERRVQAARDNTFGIG